MHHIITEVESHNLEARRPVFLAASRTGHDGPAYRYTFSVIIGIQQKAIRGSSNRRETRQVRRESCLLEQVGVGVADGSRKLPTLVLLL